MTSSQTNQVSSFHLEGYKRSRSVSSFVDMRLKLVILVTFCFLLACSSGTPGGKGKKGKNRKRDREESRDSPPANDRNRNRGQGSRLSHSAAESRGRGSNSRDPEPGSGDVRGGRSSRPVSLSRENRRNENPAQPRRRLEKQDPRRHSSQQNGPMPESPNGDTPSAIQRRPSGGTPMGFGVGIAAVGIRTSTAGSQNRLSEEQKGIFLETHNQFRSEVTPVAANMLVLEWDDTLADMAQGWADQCTFAHGNPENNSPFGYIGQNIWAGSGSTDTWNLFDMVKSWADEKEFYDYSSNSCSGVCGHYTQLVWAATTHVGCALASCSLLEGLGWSPATVLVCNYGEGGNYVGQKPYRRGQPCSQCPSDYNRCTRTQLCTPADLPENPQPDVSEPVAPPPPQGGGNEGAPQQPSGGTEESPSTGTSCGGTLTAVSGVISSPNWPLPYDNGLNCEWIIQGGPNAHIFLHFLYMDIESAAQCPWDYLLVEAEDLNQVKYCGNVPPSPIQSSRNTVKVEFSSDDSVARGGFKLLYSIQEPETEETEVCGGTITGKKGVIRSPGYPSNYPHNSDCLWTIQAPKKKRVRVSFRAFDIEEHNSCEYDSLTLQLGPEKVPMKLCGSEFIRGGAYISLSNEMMIHFRSDNQGAATGFVLNWKVI